MSLKVASPSDVRARIDAIREDIIIPKPSAKFPNGRAIVKADIIKAVDMIALVGGFRIDEVVTKHSEADANTSETLTVEATTHQRSREEALVFKVAALKKRAPEYREFGVPLNPYYEPLAKPILAAWEKAAGNPCSVNRQNAWEANKQIYAGLGYTIEPYIRFVDDLEDFKRRSAHPENIVGARQVTVKGKLKWEIQVAGHIHQAGNHLHRYARTEELENRIQLREIHVNSYFRWTPLTFGSTASKRRYNYPKWHEYFQDLLIPYSGK